MKAIIIIISVFFTHQAFSQNKITPEIFGRIQGNKFIIVGDSSKLKSKILNLIFSNRKEKAKLCVQISKSQTIGETIEDYYFVLLQDKKKNIKIAKWLEKRGNDLLLVDEFNDKNYWQVLTTACIGKDDCSPQVVITDSKKEWICGHKLICSKDKTCMKISAIDNE
ncbi:MAG: hypothetical protein H7250_03635 [Flavobacterium sp.]|nr:hypothetical protein [Flavobacterium sp.]